MVVGMVGEAIGGRTVVTTVAVGGTVVVGTGGVTVGKIVGFTVVETIGRESTIGGIGVGVLVSGILLVVVLVAVKVVRLGCQNEK